MPLVKWSPHADKEGNPMVEIAGSHFPQELAHEILTQLQQLLSEAPPKEA